MKAVLTKADLNDETRLKTKLRESFPAKEISNYNEEDLSSLLLSAIRLGENNMVKIEERGSRKQYVVDTAKAQQWIERRLLPSTVRISADDSELLQLLVFSMAKSYKILESEASQSASDNGGRIGKRYFEQICAGVFKEKIGEIAFKKFAKEKFGKDISLDWDISTDISAFKTDIVASKEIVSIKSTDTLESIWAEAPPDANYGIFVKVAIPKDFFMKILAHISSLKKLLRFVEEKLDKNDSINDLLKFIEDTAYKEEMTIRAYVCGFYKTSTGTLRDKGQELPFLGGVFEVFEEKHMTECSKLKYLFEDWKALFSIILP